MTNDLKNFLEKYHDNEIFSDDQLGEIQYVIIPKVLDLVEKEVKKIEVKKFGRYTIEKDAEEIINTIVNETKKCVSIIIKQLRV